MALKPIAYVQAAWHTEITDHCRTAFMAEMAKQGLIRYGAAVPAAAVPVAVEACIKAYLQATRAIARRIPALADDDEVPQAFAALPAKRRPPRKKRPRAKPKPRRTTGRKRS